ncbi:hypothetical protein [Streptomyces sp. TE33382]
MGQTMGAAELGRELGDAGGPLFVAGVATIATLTYGYAALAGLVAIGAVLAILRRDSTPAAVGAEQRTTTRPRSTHRPANPPDRRVSSVRATDQGPRRPRRRRGRPGQPQPRAMKRAWRSHRGRCGIPDRTAASHGSRPLRGRSAIDPRLPGHPAR